MSTIRSTAQLRDQGFSNGELARLVKREQLVRLRRGAYAEPSAETLSPESRHRQLVAATAPMVAADAVVSHRSAAVLHGLPLLQLHAAALGPDEVTLLDGLPVTSLARTVTDLARTLPFDMPWCSETRP